MDIFTKYSVLNSCEECGTDDCPGCGGDGADADKEICDECGKMKSECDCDTNEDAE